MIGQIIWILRIQSFLLPRKTRYKTHGIEVNVKGKLQTYPSRYYAAVINIIISSSSASPPSATPLPLLHQPRLCLASINHASASPLISHTSTSHLISHTSDQPCFCNPFIRFHHLFSGYISREVANCFATISSGSIILAISYELLFF